MRKKETDVSFWIVGAVLVVGAMVLIATVAMLYQINTTLLPPNGIGIP